MKQKLTILAMVVLATIFIATPVLAAGSSRTMEVATKTPTIISMTATIVSRSTTRIYVKILMTNRAFIQYRGRSEWVNVEDAVCYDWVRGTKSARVSCGKLAAGNKVSINARIDPNTKAIAARRVLRYQPRLK